MYVASQFQTPRGKVLLLPICCGKVLRRDRQLRGYRAGRGLPCRHGVQEIGALSSAMFIVLPINALVFVVSMSTFLGRPLKDAVIGALKVLPHILKKFWSVTP
jgi:hypothetical protein